MVRQAVRHGRTGRQAGRQTNWEKTVRKRLENGPQSGPRPSVPERSSAGGPLPDPPLWELVSSAVVWLSESLGMICCCFYAFFVGCFQGLFFIFCVSISRFLFFSISEVRKLIVLFYCCSCFGPTQSYCTTLRKLYIAPT